MLTCRSEVPVWGASLFHIMPVWAWSDLQFGRTWWSHCKWSFLLLYSNVVLLIIIIVSTLPDVFLFSAGSNVTILVWGHNSFVYIRFIEVEAGDGIVSWWRRSWLLPLFACIILLFFLFFFASVTDNNITFVYLLIVATVRCIQLIMIWFSLLTFVSIKERGHLLFLWIRYLVP